MALRQLPAASARSAGVNSTRISFSASAKVADDTIGPTGGAVPNAGGVPGAGSGVCAGVAGVCCILPREATAAPKRPMDVLVKNCLRDCDIIPPPQDYSGLLVVGVVPD